MLIDRIFQAVKTLVNTDGNGNFDPTDFNLNLYLAILEKQNELIFEINQMVNRENRGLINGGLENIPDRIREKLLHYLEVGTATNTAGLYDIPANLKYFDTITDANDNTFEPCKSMEEFNLIKNVNANTQYPIFLKISTKFKVAPATINSPLIIYYLRKPLFPKWTYVMHLGQPLFDPTSNTFQDADIHESDEDYLIKRVALLSGVNLKDPELTATMANEENKEFNQNNAT
jgi:hypothetical protein